MYENVLHIFVYVYLYIRTFVFYVSLAYVMVKLFMAVVRWAFQSLEGSLFAHMKQPQKTCQLWCYWKCLNLRDYLGTISSCYTDGSGRVPTFAHQGADANGWMLYISKPFICEQQTAFKQHPSTCVPDFLTNRVLMSRKFLSQVPC